MMTGTLTVFQLPGFWRGAAAARAELMHRHSGETDEVLRYHQAIGAHESIADALGAGKALDDIPAFALWLASALAVLPPAHDEAAHAGEGE